MFLKKADDPEAQEFWGCLGGSGLGQPWLRGVVPSVAAGLQLRVLVW